jgi:general stress protein 26
MLTTEQEVNIKKLATMIRGVKVAMLTTQGPDGRLHSRPMATQEKEFDGTLWFFTNAGSEKAYEISEHAQVNLSYVSPEGHHYVSCSGRASLVRDPERMEELWSANYRAWFPRGLDDPDVVLLRVDVETAAHWDMISAAMVDMLEIERTTAPNGE